MVADIYPELKKSLVQEKFGWLAVEIQRILYLPKYRGSNSKMKS